jgi:hypothetical protein
MVLARLSVMNQNHNDQPSEFQLPIGVASFACLATLTFFYWYAGSAVKLLDVWWAKLLVYALIPILVTFIILYHSGWHRVVVGPTRTCSLLLLSCAILVGVLFAIGAILALVWFGSIAIYPRVGGR